jgi:hypothetical protein
VGRDVEKVTGAEGYGIHSIRTGFKTNSPGHNVAVNLAVLVVMLTGSRTRISARVNYLEILALVCLNHLDVHVVPPYAVQVAFECCNERDGLAFHVIANHN